MTQIVLIEETSAVKTETKADKRKRESALKKEQKEAMKEKQAEEEAERLRVREQETARFHARWGWVDYPANRNKQSN